jgi:hypothetical protein
MAIKNLDITVPHAKSCVQLSHIAAIYCINMNVISRPSEISSAMPFPHYRSRWSRQQPFSM